MSPQSNQSSQSDSGRKRARKAFEGIIVFALMALLTVFGVASIVSADNSASLWSMRDAGQAIGHQIVLSTSSYTTFGTGSSGEISVINLSGNSGLDYLNTPSKGNIIFSPMTNASDYNKIQSGTNTLYGLMTKPGSPGEGVGVLSFAFTPKHHDRDYNITLVSGNYGTKSTGNDLDWCLVFRENHQYMKFTNLAKAYPHSSKPLTCVNGK